jgi:hypothetical protein
VRLDEHPDHAEHLGIPALAPVDVADGQSEVVETGQVSAVLLALRRSRW